MADYQYINEQGVIVPDTSTILDGVQNEFKNAFGNDLIVTPDTPQGVLIVAETLSRDAVVRNNAALANQINPNLAGGKFLDAICALTRLERVKATRSTVTAQLSGVPTTIIPAGVRAETVSGDVFELIGAVTLDGSGNATGAFQSVEFGPISAPAGELTQIVDGVLGWENITNADAAVLGRAEQSDVSLRALRKNTLALQGVSLPYAISSALYATEGVKSLTFRENVTNAPATIDGILIGAHSIYVCVDGGTNQDVALSLLENKSLGAGWTGGTTVTVTDPTSGQPYDVKFDRPTAVPVVMEVTVRVGNALINATTAVKEAIMAYVNGELEGEPGFTVGSSVSSFELAGAVNRVYPDIYVQLLQTKKASDPSFSSAEIPIGINQIATTNPSSILVTIV